jgi:SAM-dependent methyltransferase
MRRDLKQPSTPRRDASWDLAAYYDCEYYAYYSSRDGEPYVRGNPRWEAFFARVAGFIVDEFHPETVLDVGCGIGFLVQALRQRGVSAWGFDISEYAISQVPASVKAYCEVASVTDGVERDFDLIVCVEVLEHIPPHLTDLALENLTAHTDQILFSSTPDDDEEPTHINLRSPDEWVVAFAERNFFPRPTMETRHVGPQAMVLVRGSVSAASVAANYEAIRYRLASDLAAARESAQHALVEMETAAADLRGRIAILEGRIAVLEQELQSIQSSKTWRFGAPVRALSSAVRSLPKIPRRHELGQ